MSDPQRLGSILSQLPFVRAGGERAAQFLREVRDQAPQSYNSPERRAARKRRVLAHDWAVKRLRLIVGDPQKWNGYVPDARNPNTYHETGGRHLPSDRERWLPNETEQRLAIVALLAEVAEFERTAQLPADVTPDSE